MAENETRPGGVYFVNGRWLDANGRPTDPPVTPKAKAKKAEETKTSDESKEAEAE